MTMMTQLSIMMDPQANLVRPTCACSSDMSCMNTLTAIVACIIMCFSASEDDEDCEENKALMNAPGMATLLLLFSLHTLDAKSLQFPQAS